MDRNFALLGLREDASKAQVKAAYERRLSKYKAADYADDPEYVRRKIAQLKAAYEQAYRKAGGGGQAQNAAQPVRPAAGSQRPRRISVSDRDEEKETFRKTAEKTVRKTVERNYEEPAERTAEDTAERTLEETIRMGPSDEQKGSAKIAGIVGVVITVIAGLISLGIGGSDVSYDSWDEDDYSLQSYYDESDYSEDDEKVLEQGRQITAVFEESDIEFDADWEYVSTDDEKLEKAANRFAKRYTGYETMGELCDSLYERVGGFSARSDNSLDFQIEEVLNYYGFPSMDWACGYINPYTGETMTELTGYLKYLNRYWKENFE